MYSEDHYLSKIERNTLVLDKAPEELRPQIAANIEWCRNVAARLEQLDYDVRQQTIAQMHRILDSDYRAMGFGPLEETQEGRGR